MSIDQNIMDGVIEVVIPTFEIRYRDRDGELRRGMGFRDFLTLRMADGTDMIIQNQLRNLEIHDHAVGHGLLVFRLENVPPSNDDGTIVHADDSNV
jgi:hypothetical protein